MSEIHWFPGHMKKALNELENKLKIVDVVVILLDSRCPFSSTNEYLSSLIQNKKKLIVLSKADLADSKQLELAKKKLLETNDEVLTANLKVSGSEKQISNAIGRLAKTKHAKDAARGMKPQPVKVMIIGIPNVGKSSLINRLANRKAAGVENRPGFTRGEQWVKVNNDFLLLDTPGILPMNYEKRENAIHLALSGSIKETILPNTDLCEYLISFLAKHYPNALKERFGIEQISNDALKQIAEARHLLDSNGQLNIDRAEAVLLKETKDGLLGKLSFDHE